LCTWPVRPGLFSANVLAARLVGSVDNRLDMLSIELLALDLQQLGNVHVQLQASLDEVTYHAALVQGWRLSVEEAIQLLREAFPS
jgi:hypothetical protein